ncbi:MAG: HAD family hydrolase [Patescibacteria group bacterium UBA2103]
MKLWVTDLDNTLCDTDVLENDTSRIGELVLFDDVAKLFKVLVAQGVPIVVLTKGDFVYQRSKIHQLGLTDVIDEMYVASSDAEKAILFKKILEVYEVAPEDVVMIGDRRDAEVAIGREFGAKTIWYKHGKYNESGDVPEGVLVAENYKDILELVTDL